MHEYHIAGIVGLVVFVIALVGLRELSPGLRDQLMVTMRDRALIEARAKGIDIEASLRNPWGQLLKPDVVISAIGVRVFLLIYYTAVGFALIFFTTVFGFSVHDGNALGNWNWGFNVIAVIMFGFISDKLRVRKPLMIVGGVGSRHHDRGVPGADQATTPATTTWPIILAALAVLPRRGLRALDGQLHRDGRGPQSRPSPPPAWPSGAGSSGSRSSSRS